VPFELLTAIQVFWDVTPCRLVCLVNWTQAGIMSVAYYLFFR